MTAHATPRQTKVFFNAGMGISDPIGTPASERHEVILQALNRYLLYDEEGDPVRIYYSVENYAGTEPAWDKTPAIFVEDGTHPDLDLFRTDPERALDTVKGRYAGILENTEIVSAPGQPRAKSWLTITDPEAAALYAAGELALSTALSCRELDGRLQGQVSPNHVLLFKAGPGAQPRDGGAMFLNSMKTETGGPKVDKLDEVLNSFSNSIKAIFGPGQGGNNPDGGGNGGNDPEMTPDDEKLKLANSAIEQKDQEAKALKEQKAAVEMDLANAQKELEKFRQEEAEKNWTALKNSIIPPGMVKAPEAEKELRELYNTDRDGFYQKIMAVQKRAPGREGNAWVNTEKFKQIQEANNAWDQATGASIKI